MMVAISRFRGIPQSDSPSAEVQGHSPEGTQLLQVGGM